MCDPSSATKMRSGLVHNRVRLMLFMARGSDCCVGLLTRTFGCFLITCSKSSVIFGALAIACKCIGCGCSVRIAPRCYIERSVSHPAALSQECRALTDDAFSSADAASATETIADDIQREPHSRSTMSPGHG